MFADGAQGVVRLHLGDVHGAAGGAAQARLSAPMPGRVAALLVAAGDTVKSGQPLLVLEAMKMEHTLHAADDGVIDAVLVAVGEQIGEGAALLRMRETEATETAP